MAEALVDARAADPIAAIVDRARTAERFNMRLLPKDRAERRCDCSSGLLVGSHAGEVHPTAARFHPHEAATRLSIAQEIQRAAASDGCTTLPTQAAAANNRSAMRPRVLIFSRRRREIAAIEGLAVCPAATFIGGHLG